MHFGRDETARVPCDLVQTLVELAQRAIFGHVKLMFINGTTLEPEPPVTPVGMGKATRGVELATVDEIDAAVIASWMTQITSRPGLGRARR